MNAWFVTWLAVIGFGLLTGVVFFVVALVIERRQRRQHEHEEARRLRRRRTRAAIALVDCPYDHEGKP